MQHSFCSVIRRATFCFITKTEVTLFSLRAGFCSDTARNLAALLQQVCAHSLCLFLLLVDLCDLSE